MPAKIFVSHRRQIKHINNAAGTELDKQGFLASSVMECRCAGPLPVPSRPAKVSECTIAAAQTDTLALLQAFSHCAIRSMQLT